MRVYEELFIVRPDAPDEDVDHLVEQLQTFLTGAKATVDKVDKWGKRKLAYRIGKFREGAYILIQFSAKPETVKEVERRLRVNDLVIKFITVRIDENLKRIEKRKKARDKRAARRPAPVAPQPSVAQQMLGGAEKPTSVPGLPQPGAPAPAHAAPAQPAPAPAAPAPAVPQTEES